VCQKKATKEQIYKLSTIRKQKLVNSHTNKGILLLAQGVPEKSYKRTNIQIVHNTKTKNGQFPHKQRDSGTKDENYNETP